MEFMLSLKTLIYSNDIKKVNTGFSLFFLNEIKNILSISYISILTAENK